MIFIQMYKTVMYFILKRNFQMLFFFSRRCLIICMLLITFYSCYSFSFNNQQMTSNLLTAKDSSPCYKTYYIHHVHCTCIKVLCQIYMYMYIWTLILTAKHYFLELIKIAVVRLVLMNFKLHYPMVRLYSKRG